MLEFSHQVYRWPQRAASYTSALHHSWTEDSRVPEPSPHRLSEPYWLSGAGQDTPLNPRYLKNLNPDPRPVDADEYTRGPDG